MVYGPPVRALALDPVTGDFARTAGRLTLVEGAAAVAQQLRGHVALWLGEWFGDTSIGVAFLAFLGQKGAQRLAEASLRQAVVTCPGVASLEDFALTALGDRSATVALRVKTTSGAYIDDFFRVGA